MGVPVPKLGLLKSLTLSKKKNLGNGDDSLPKPSSRKLNRSNTILVNDLDPTPPEEKPQE